MKDKVMSKKVKKNNVQKVYNRNHLYFEFRETKFDVDNEKNIVSCKISGFFISEWPFTDVVKRVYRRNGFKVGYEDYGFLEGYAEFTGFVKCNENDKFDETTGKRLAESKVKSKIYLKSIEILSQIAEESEKEIQNLKNLGGKYLGYFAKEQVHQLKVDFKQNGNKKPESTL